MGDEAAIAIAKSLPASVSEIGLVECGLSDKSGQVNLNWMKKVLNLRMVCIEGNNFSHQFKMEFRNFKKSLPEMLFLFYFFKVKKSFEKFSTNR